MAPTNKPMRYSEKSHNNGEKNSHQISVLANVSRFRGDFIPCNYDADKCISSLFSEVDEIAVAKVPSNVEDYDKVNCNDIFQVPQYAAEIFQYLKQREEKFVIVDYMPLQKHISKALRTMLVDRMIGVQQKLNLNRETLHLAIKIVDTYLCNVLIAKDQLQLLGTTALLIASKYEECIDFEIKDFLNFSNGSNTRAEVMTMEVLVLRAIDYNLGIPLSYGFLRRYALCAKIPNPTLTLALYILEKSMMFYGMIRNKDSLMAAAALFMALRMHGVSKPWTATLQHYSGYALDEFAGIVPLINAGVHQKCEALTNLCMKYPQYELRMVHLKTNDELLENNINLGACV